MNETNEVRVDFSSVKILKVDDLECKITLSFALYLTWREPRLIIPKEVAPYVALDKSFFNQLWKPDVYIFNLQSIKKQALFYDFEGLYLVNNTLGKIHVLNVTSISLRMFFTFFGILQI